MQVRDAMRGEVLTVTPERTLAEAAQHMHERGLSAALIIDPEQPGPGVVTQRDLLRALGEGKDPARERIEDHLTAGAKFAAPDWSLDEAAEAMVRGGFRHLAVIEGEDPEGMLAMRDIVRTWLEHGEFPSRPTPIHEAMSTDLLTVGAEDTLRQAAAAMTERNVGAAVVTAEETGDRPGLVTERVLMECVAGGVDVDAEQTSQRLSENMTYSAPDWSLKQAAEAMTKGGFEHIVVVEPRRTCGIISMRDIVRHWTEAG